MKALIAFAALAFCVNACKDGDGATLATGTQTPSAARTPPPLTGGADVLGENPFAAFNVPQSAALKIETAGVTGQDFNQIWRVTALKPLESPWSAQLSAQNLIALKKGDVIPVRFWARAATGAAQTEFVMELGAPPYDKSITLGVKPSGAWTVYQTAFRAHRDYAVGEAAIHFRLGYANQTLELGGVILKNYGSSKGVSDIPSFGFGNYAGREANAAWRTAANARIDELRKADLKVRVVDANNQPVSGASVHLQMKRHAFPFGSAIDARRLFENATYRAKSVELFNRVVLENDLKWPGWESGDFSRAQTLKALQFFKDNGVSVRGHNLIWPCNDDYCLPADVVASFGDPEKLRARIDSHLKDILGTTQGQLVEWDVVNEPSANKRLAKILGEDEMAVWYKRAKELEPNARLFVNDYGNLGEGTLDVEYKRIIQRLLDLGAPLEGIGLQAHFGWELTPPEELYARLEAFSKFGLPLAITEFDINVTDEQLQADYLRDFMTVAFSHKGVSSFLMWGFWAGQHWLPDAALYREDWSLKPIGRTWLDLVKRTWWTDTSVSSDAAGKAMNRSFLGDYELTATLGAKTVTVNVKLGETSGEFTLKLP
jgi:endo-1,4-beta-xylanase